MATDVKQERTRDEKHETTAKETNGTPPALASDRDIDPAETQEWLDSLEAVLQAQGTERAEFLLSLV